MLDQLFSSRTRVKLLSLFLSNSDSDYFVRELTRITDEQINSIRRELTNLEQLGLLKSHALNNKKYYTVNKEFLIFEELKSIFTKASGISHDIVSEITKHGDIDLISISGKLIEQTNSNIEILIVGNTDKIRTEQFLKELEQKQKHEIRFAIFSRKDFLVRLDCNDRFLSQFFTKQKNVTIYDKIKLKKYL